MRGILHVEMMESI